MEQPLPDERLAIKANVDQLVQELHYLSRRATPADERNQTGCDGAQATTVVATGR